MKKTLHFSAALFFFSLLFPLLLSFPSSVQSDNLLHSVRLASAESGGSILDEAVFFGDSTTYGLLFYNVNNTGQHGKNYHTLKASQIWVPEGGTFYLGNLFTARIALSDGRRLTLAEAAKEIQPKYLILTVGINGLCSWTKDRFSDYYEKMVDLVRENSPDTHVILHAVYPSASNIGGQLENFTNDKIDRMNGWIREIAENKGLQYLDSASALKDETGCMRLEYQNGDGLHLNTQGFNVILENIDRNAER